MNENWKDIQGYEGLYMASDIGRIKSLVTNRMLKPAKNHKGYYCIALRDREGNSTYSMVARFVALAFIPNPEGKPQVDHIDNDKTNDCVSNLRWATNLENMHNEKSIAERKVCHKHPVNQYTLEGELINTWNNATFAAIGIGKTRNSANTIRSCCNHTGFSKTAFGFKWEWATEHKWYQNRK